MLIEFANSRKGSRAIALIGSIVLAVGVLLTTYPIGLDPLGAASPVGVKAAALSGSVQWFVLGALFATVSILAAALPARARASERLRQAQARG